MNKTFPTLLSCVQSAVVLYEPREGVPGIEERVRLSSGTCPARTIDNSAPPYVDDARAPVPDWRPATHAENAVLWSRVAPPAHRGVGIVRLLSPTLLRLFEDRGDIFGRAADADTLRHPLMNLLLEIIAGAGIVSSNLHSARIGHDEPGRITMTKAVDKDARIGLHVDRWDLQRFDELQHATNRISINLGPTDRYFIFVNQTAAGMAAILEQSGANVVRDVSVVGKAFMSAFPHYPVVRLCLRPGEAYVAPTENILHDGSSAEVPSLNRYLSIRGCFEFAGT